MDKFKIKTYLPIASNFLYIKELKNKKVLELNKFILSNDNEGVDKFLNSLFKNDIVRNNFDKFFALVNLRMISVGDKINLQINKNNEPTSTIKITLSNFLNRLIDNIDSPISDFKKETLRITFNLPTKLYFKNFIVLLLDCINDIYINEKSIGYNNLSLKEKTNILLKFKKDIVSELKKHINKSSKKYELIKIENVDINYYISFYNNSAFELLKFLFKTKISNVYNKIFFCSQKLNMSLKDFNSITPSETDLLIAIYKKNNSIK